MNLISLKMKIALLLLSGRKRIILFNMLNMLMIALSQNFEMHTIIEMSDDYITMHN